MDLNKLKNDPDQIKALIGLLSSLLEDNTDNNDTETVDESLGHKHNIKTKKVKTKGKSQNLFDKMPEKNQHKDDVAIDKKLSVLPPTERAREFEYVKVKCRACGKVENCHPSLINDSSRYKCNKCCTSAG